MNERINTVFHRTIDNLSAAMAAGSSGGSPGSSGGNPALSGAPGGNLTDANRSRSLRQTRTPLTRSKAVKSPDWSMVANTPEWSSLGPPPTTAPPPPPMQLPLRKGGASVLRNGVLIRSAAATIAGGGKSTSSEGDDAAAAAANRSCSSSSSGASAKACRLYFGTLFFFSGRYILMITGHNFLGYRNWLVDK